jgi:hypothetical protein
MSIILDPAKRFFEACETGKGWDECKAYCHPDATFSSQTNALSDISTLESYCEWMKNLFTPVPDGHYELKFFTAIVAWNYVRRIVSFGAVFLISALCHVDTLAAQSNFERALEPTQVFSSGTNVLGPPSNGGPVIVGTSFQLHNIHAINDEAETFQFMGVLTLTWKDKRQAFDPDKEGIQEKIYQGAYQFNEVSPGWYPQVILVNVSDMFEKHGVILRVLPDGTSTLIETVNATVEADFKMQRYPFDSQRLEAVFVLLGYDSSEVVFEAEPVPVDSSLKKMKISQWQLTAIRNSTAEQSTLYTGKRGISSKFILSIEVQRKPLFIIRLVVFPLALIVLVSWSVFWMERSSLSDRINISFIGILTSVALQMVVSDIMPQISYITIANGFVTLSFFLMCATVVINLIVSEYDKRGKPDVGDLIDYRCRWIFPLVYFGLVTLFIMVMFLV